MLRGLDARVATADYESIIVKVADREVISGSLTVYIDEECPPSTRRRFRKIGERLAFFADAGVCPTPTAVPWSTDLAFPTSEADRVTAARYEEFHEAVGEEGLGPFFERMENRRVSMPDLCLAFRRNGRLSGLYPRVADGHVQTVDECLTGLSAGNDVENVDC